MLMTKEFIRIINYGSSASYSSILQTVGRDPSVVCGKQ